MASRIGLNVGARLAASQLFINIIKEQFQIVSMTRDGNVNYTHANAISDGDVFDEDGNFKSPFPSGLTRISIYFVLRPPAYDFGHDAGWTQIGEQWTAIFDGTADIDTLFVRTGSDSNDTANRITWTWTAEPGNALLIFDITDTDDPPILNSIRVFRTENEAAFLAGEMFDPQMLTDLSGWAFLRGMDLQNINNSTVVDYDDIATEDYVKWAGPALVSGLPSRMPISIQARLSNDTQVPPWFCIPHQATNAAALAMLTKLDEELDPSLAAFIEFTNEPWNPQFDQYSYCATQGATLFAGDSSDGRAKKWYGYRAAQIMMLARQVFGASGRTWYGQLGAQTGVTSVTTANFTGIDTFLTRLAAGDEAPTFPIETLTKADLFTDVAGTTYFGRTITPATITAATEADPGVFTSNGHGLQNDQRCKTFFRAASGMIEMDERFVIIANRTANTFELLDADTEDPIDTTGYTTFISASSAFIVPALLWDAMDASAAAHTSDPIENPTIYSHFAEQLAQDCIDGTTIGAITNTIEDELAGFWVAMFAQADAVGLGLTAYEGGDHNVGAGQLTNNTVYDEQFNAFYINKAHTHAMARAHQIATNTFFAAGGRLTCKYTHAGLPTEFGPWGMKRWHGDNNPVSQITRANNLSKKTFIGKCVAT